MPLFALNCLDKPNALPVRLGAREAHLAWAKDQPIKFAGPYLNDVGEMCGSLIVLEVADLDGAKAFNAADPYTHAGLWASVDIRPFRVTVDNR